MTCRIPAARLRADYAAMGTLIAVARKHSACIETIKRRAPDLGRGPQPGYKSPADRAAFLHHAGLTMDEVTSATGLGYRAIIEAVRARHARQQGA